MQLMGRCADTTVCDKVYSTNETDHCDITGIVLKVALNTITFIINNSKFADFVDHIYPTELEIKNTSDTAWSASLFDLHF